MLRLSSSNVEGRFPRMLSHDETDSAHNLCREITRLMSLDIKVSFQLR